MDHKVLHRRKAKCRDIDIDAELIGREVVSLGDLTARLPGHRAQRTADTEVRDLPRRALIGPQIVGVIPAIGDDRICAAADLAHTRRPRRVSSARSTVAMPPDPIREIRR